jgi:DNA helicase-2/ATP-dependent DNA helicase PcrA
MTSNAAGPDRITVAGFPTENAEAEFIVKTIEGLIGGSSHFAIDSGRGGNDAMADLAFRDIAVLYRVHAAGDAVVEAFDRSGIPVQRVARRSLLDESDIRAVAAALAFAETPTSRFRAEDLLRMHWPGLSRSSADRLRARLRAGFDESGSALEWLRARQDISAIEAASLSRIHDVLSGVDAALREGGLRRALIVAARGMGATEEELAARHWTIVNERAKACPTAAEFLASLSLDNEADFYDPRSEGISLMTLHAAKGLEWKIVFIVGCEEGFIPYIRSGAEPDIAEERRLLYVGITRAKYQLHLSHARTRMIHGRKEQRRESPFIGEIPEALKYQHVEKTGYSKRVGRSDALQLGLFD